MDAVLYYGERALSDDIVKLENTEEATVLVEAKALAERYDDILVDEDALAEKISSSFKRERNISQKSLMIMLDIEQWNRDRKEKGQES